MVVVLHVKRFVVLVGFEVLFNRAVFFGALRAFTGLLTVFSEGLLSVGRHAEVIASGDKVQISLLARISIILVILLNRHLQIANTLIMSSPPSQQVQ